MVNMLKQRQCGGCSLTSGPKGWETGRLAGRQTVSPGGIQLSVGVITCQSAYLSQQAWPKDRATGL